MTVITSDKVIRALAAGGLDIGDPNTIRRIIIDLRPGHLPTIHVEHTGHETVLRIVESVDPGSWTIIMDTPPPRAVSGRHVDTDSVTYWGDRA